MGAATTFSRPSAPAAAQARAPIRAGIHTGHTAGLAPGHVQGNLMILPRALAEDFLRFCQRNPQACPLLAVSEPGDPALPELGPGIDIRHDLPRYRVWRDGVLTDEPTDIAALWRDDLVSFVIGCSFSFEHALLDAGVPLRHVALGRNVAMYRTSIATVPAGPFHGPMVVSMRPMTPAHAVRAVQITSRFPKTHGAPVHIGLPAMIGIADLARPDFGDHQRGARRRTARVLGLRRHTPVGRDGRQAAVLHHACPRLHAGHRLA